MPLDYNNIDAPFFSETEREFSPVQNWTTNGCDSLTLYFHGKATNGPGNLYVTIEDSADKQATAVHPAPQALLATEWTEWKTPLSAFAGVNPAKVKKLRVGVGDRSDPVAGGVGMVFIDDIRVTRP